MARVAKKTTTKSSTKSTAKKILAPEITRDWSWLLGLGILFVIFGFLGLSTVVGVTSLVLYLLALCF